MLVMRKRVYDTLVDTLAASMAAMTPTPTGWIFFSPKDSRRCAALDELENA